MKVSTKGRYGLRLMIDIAARGSDRVTTLREVSQAQAISVKYLEQLVPPLVGAGLLQGHRGARGGYSLARPAESITAGDIIRASEGGVAPIACLEDDFGVCPRRDVCESLAFWQGLEDAIERYVDGVTLDDLVEQSREAQARAALYAPSIPETPC